MWSWRGIAKSNGQGVKSLLAGAEKALVAIGIQMGKIRQPLNCTEAIELMNNLIQDTDSQKALLKFQRMWKLGSKGGKASKGWWAGFLCQHEHELVTKQRERFALNRHDWMTLENIKQIYDVIYDEMVDAKIAIELVAHTSTDQYGNTVDEEGQFGMKQNSQITHPSYIMFADESGFSTLQKKDDHVGGQKFVVESGTIPQIVASATDHKFILLPFTSATSKAVCCVIIFQSK